ncbi:MAG: hypothetical protein PHU46_07945 [Rhodocyclaceae bacterium]|nr:hypothetical protein [Rhodocyclaceae bacterium]
MLDHIPLPNDRPSFDNALTVILSEHATLRNMALAASQRLEYSPEDATSLAAAMTAHESSEARLFALPFLTKTPKSVISTGSRARQRCLAYTSGNFHHRDPRAAANLFVEALLVHLDEEETWLAREQELHHERLLQSI